MSGKRPICVCLFIIAVIALGTTGCQTMTYSVEPGGRVYCGTPQGVKPVRTFREARKAHYLLWGLVPLGRPGLQQVADEELRPGEMLVGIVIKENNTFVDGLLAAFTLGIYRPRTVEINGRVCVKEGLGNAK